MEEAAYRYLAQGLQHVIAQLPAQKTATELMTKTVFCVAPDDSMEEARLMCTMHCTMHNAHTHTHTCTCTRTHTCTRTRSRACQARLKMLRVNKKSTPVVDADGKFSGTLKYNAVVKAAKAGKSQQQVKAWMRREGVTVKGDTPLDDLERVMESEGAGRLPVVSDEGKLLGLVTRTDVLRERKLYASVGGTARRVR